MKVRCQTRYLQVGDIVGSGETITSITLAGINIPSSKVLITLQKGDKTRTAYWGKYTEINAERPDGTPSRTISSEASQSTESSSS